MMKKLTLFLWLLPFLVQAQTYQNGLLLPINPEKVASANEFTVYLPKGGFPAYDTPNGQRIGRIDFAAHEGDVSFIGATPQSEITAAPEYYKQISYSKSVLVYNAQKQGFVRVMGKYWLKARDVQARGFKVDNWQNFLNAKAGKLLGYYANDPGLNLRSAPTIKGKRIKTLKGELMQITPLNVNQGMWAKVRVRKLKRTPCETNLSEKENTEYVLTGWIKILDNDGTPNVWFYPKGC